MNQLFADGMVASSADDALSGHRLQRAQGEVRAVVGLTPRADATRTGLRRLHQAGCLKLRFPRLPHSSCEAIVINTAGGLTGGDRVALDFEVEAEGSATVTSQACERVYRSAGGVATVDVRLSVGAAAALAYVPQETILFDGGRLSRRFQVECRSDSRLLVAESVVLGRSAMGETVSEGDLADRWRIRRNSWLIFADDLRLRGAIDRLVARAAVLGGAVAFSTLLWQGPDPEGMLLALRGEECEIDGVSLVDGLVVARLVAPDGYELRRRLMPVLARLAHGPLPRVWSL